MDSILLVGCQDDKLGRLLNKMGYVVKSCGDLQSFPALAQTEIMDLLVVDSTFGEMSQELIHFLRGLDSTKQVPIIFLSDERHLSRRLAEQGIDRVEVVARDCRVGQLVGKVATQLRLRKLNGADESSATLGEINARLRDLNERFRKQLEEAQAIQKSVISTNLPRDKRFDLAISYQPLEEVGGDWYFASQTNDQRLALQIADVTGHGLSAAFIACITKLAMTASNSVMPHELLRDMNVLMAPNIPAGRFVTMFSALYDPATGHLDLARAGHPPALVLNRKKNEVRQIKGEGFAVGFFDDSVYSHEQAHLDEGDVLLMFTDAIPESQNMRGETYNYDAIEAVLLKSDPKLSASELLVEILEDFDRFRDGRLIKDDVTVLLLKRSNE